MVKLNFQLISDQSESKTWTFNVKDIDIDFNIDCS